MSDGALGPPRETTPIHDGTVVKLRVSHYTRPSGARVRREVIDHPGAVVMIPVEDEHVLLVRQPRDAIERMTLELPAGKLDGPHEPPEDCARRELAEEVGRAAARWEDLGGFWTAPAILTEFMHCFLAEDLSPAEGVPDDDEEIEIVRHPLADLDGLIARADDAKTLIGLMRLRERLAG